MRPFFNPHVEQIRRGFLDLILWKAGYYDDAANTESVPDSFTYPISSQPVRSDLPTVQWVNHSTFLISIDGINMLTDPIWAERCSPLSFVGPKRRHAPALRFDELPEIHFVFISHNHYDHLDKPTVKALFAKYPRIEWIVPRGVEKWFKKLGISRTIEIGWWQEKDFGAIKATGVPAQHFSGRRGYDLNWTLWLGYVIEFKNASKTLYFVGDTGYNSHDFKEIGRKWPSIDLSLIPIGAYTPRKFMSSVHIEPRDAVQIHTDVASKLSIGMHWNTFNLADEKRHQPPYDLFLALKAANIDPTVFLAMPPGHVLNW